MASITSLFHAYCKEQLKPLGFVKQGMVWGRIIGDVYQGISIRQSSIKTPIIAFGILPLCAGIDFYDSIEQYDLDNLYPLENFQSVLDCDPRFADNEAIMEKLKNRIEESVLPMFEKCIDCTSSFDPLMKLKYLTEHRRIQVLKHLRIKDGAIPLEERIMHDEHLFYIALKTGNYDYVMRCLKCWEKKGKKLRIDWLDALPNWIKQNDTASIRSVLQIRETKSLATLNRFLKKC